MRNFNNCNNRQFPTPTGKSNWKENVLLGCIIIGSGVKITKICIDIYKSTKGEKLKHKWRMQEENLKHEHKIAELEYKQQLWRERTDGACEDETELDIQDTPLKETNLEEWINDPSNVVEYFYDTPIRKGDLCCIYSPAGEGKSTLLFQMLLSISTGKATGLYPWSDQPNDPQPVYLFDAEQEAADYRTRYKGCDIDVTNIHRIEAVGVINIKHLIMSIKSVVEKEDNDCTIAIDNVYAIFPALSNNKVLMFKQALTEIQDTAKEHGRTVTIIVVSHAIKNAVGSGVKNLAGAVAWSRFFKSLISLQTSDYGSDYRKLTYDKNRIGPRGEGIVLKLVRTPFLHFICEDSLEDAPSDEIKSVQTVTEIDGVPIELVLQMEKEYVPDKEGCGLKAILKNHEADLTPLKKQYPIQLSRIFKKLREMREKGLIDGQ